MTRTRTDMSIVRDDMSPLLETTRWSSRLQMGWIKVYIYLIKSKNKKQLIIASRLHCIIK